ncbi:hypothetical protein PHYBLDRAFT_71327 [Phycomyces blakesleeanus NRRL 1555(-)]|uniref:Homeodomain-like DNA binding domain-containing transcription factor n=1 Tax=Phycomyces blakesleeanus (strain ATCC 8743b / DSM 1359 / FGSC 10004 / NBRC 33097 / NRRL 1555) TaxID=763407 RepID=A0A162YKX3_PHYB8|nr:hypothetical protein PHYBLDRAFT_71327 [Phycomyces blakesleeanus NRRL 1555(-)]OAD81405.1 hypothetical protein PHYBLDRAFT_71327 [Phycomyces blakesleeanus NRRL 1555(-)]|eukprot:XP_018299445.1 hypothetical protein PHYBLDRAFT_71327 [Phycomyces blakesleeanus NRRL 1555(-)]
MFLKLDITVCVDSHLLKEQNTMTISEKSQRNKKKTNFLLWYKLPLELLIESSGKYGWFIFLIFRQVGQHSHDQATLVANSDIANTGGKIITIVINALIYYLNGSLKNMLIIIRMSAQDSEIDDYDFSAKEPGVVEKTWGVYYLHKSNVSLGKIAHIVGMRRHVVQSIIKLIKETGEPFTPEMQAIAGKINED